QLAIQPVYLKPGELRGFCCAIEFFKNVGRASLDRNPLDEPAVGIHPHGDIAVVAVLCPCVHQRPSNYGPGQRSSCVQRFKSTVAQEISRLRQMQNVFFDMKKQQMGVCVEESKVTIEERRKNNTVPERHFGKRD